MLGSDNIAPVQAGVDKTGRPQPWLTEFKGLTMACDEPAEQLLQITEHFKLQKKGQGVHPLNTSIINGAGGEAVINVFVYTEESGETSLVHETLERSPSPAKTKGESDNNSFSRSHTLNLFPTPPVSPERVEKGQEIMKHGQGKAFYDLFQIPFSAVLESSTLTGHKCRIDGHLLNGCSVLYHGNSHNIEGGLKRAQELKIAIVSGDAPRQLWQADERGKGHAPKHERHVTLTKQIGLNEPHATEIAQVLKQAQGSVCADLFSGQQLNHLQGKQLLLTVLESGFKKGSSSQRNEAKDFVESLRLDVGDPMAYNKLVGALMAVFDSSEARAKTLGKFRTTVQGIDQDVKDFL